MLRRVTLKFLLAISILTGLSLVLYANAALAQEFKTHTLRSDKNVVEQYQIGEEWSRRPYAGSLTSTDSLNKAIKATARVDLKSSSGTAVYVGKFGGAHLMLTNHHVVSNITECREGRVYFEYLDKTFKCRNFVKKFKDLDTAFFTIQVFEKDEHLFEDLALKFDFVNEYKPGEKLVTAGYGVYLNSDRMLTYENSQTCVVATTNYKTKFLELKDKSSHAYSFAHSCEISHGDSGSVIISEITGKVVGLNWATITDKPKILLNTLVVFGWIEAQVPMLWDSLSYAVPTGNIMTAIRGTDSLILNEFVSSHFTGQ